MDYLFENLDRLVIDHKKLKEEHQKVLDVNLTLKEEN